jgi:hypothetical protein
MRRINLFLLLLSLALLIFTAWNKAQAQTDTSLYFWISGEVYVNQEVYQ